MPTQDPRSSTQLRRQHHRRRLPDRRPGSRLAILSTYLGHADPGATYWYLSAAPELLALVGERLERHLAGDA
jgi:hypothetical protein|tara:strand:- start:273 stop:488 length:216 start_codon:yes stop_codon:yes gene_type:complete